MSDVKRYGAWKGVAPEFGAGCDGLTLEELARGVTGTTTTQELARDLLAAQAKLAAAEATIARVMERLDGIRPQAPAYKWDEREHGVMRAVWELEAALAGPMEGERC